MNLVSIPVQKPSLPVQVLSLRQKYPASHIQSSYQRMTWSAVVQPEEWCRTYSLKLCYVKGSTPKIYVAEPNLHILSEGKRIPHLYNQEQQHLCLYLPGRAIWTPYKLLADTMVPWALSWLVFFELWLATGEWHGRAFGHAGDDPTFYVEN